MSNRDKIILGLCGGTGSWSRPYTDAGYDVRLITLPGNDVREYEPPSGVYGILAAPPCTEFSLAKGSRPRDLGSAMEVVQACLHIIWQCGIDGALKFWALENPVGLLRQFIGIPRVTIYQWQFGELQNKPTDLWGYFRPPTPTVREKPKSLAKSHHRHAGAWNKPICPPEYAHLGLDRAAVRAITPRGLADAFYRSNR